MDAEDKMVYKVVKFKVQIVCDERWIDLIDPDNKMSAELVYERNMHLGTLVRMVRIETITSVVKINTGLKEG